MLIIIKIIVLIISYRIRHFITLILYLDIMQEIAYAFTCSIKFDGSMADIMMLSRTCIL